MLKNKQIDYEIYIVEQIDEKLFNYGKLCNVVVNEIGEEYTYFAFHDIDMLPSVYDLSMPTLNYVKDRYGNLQHIKNKTNIGSFEIPISNDIIDYGNFSGFAKNGKLIIE